jgi:F0F1-type ATP synthase epsilon subunit
MFKGKINLKIVTPEGYIEDSRYDGILLPGEFGIFELLPNHENYISILRTGIISAYKNHDFIPIFIISQSFSRFDNSANTCEINSPYAIDVTNPKKVEREFINNKLEGSNNSDERYFYNYVSEYFFVNNL